MPEIVNAPASAPGRVAAPLGRPCPGEGARRAGGRGRAPGAGPRTVSGLLHSWSDDLPWSAATPTARLLRVATRWEWDALVSRQGGTYFHRARFLTTLARALGMHLDLRKVVLDGRIAGVVPMLVRRHGPLTVVNSLPFPYLGPLVAPDDLAATMAALARHEQLTGCVRADYSLTGGHPGQVHGYRELEEFTFVVPVAGRSDEDLLSGMSSRRRASIRRAERQGLQIRTATPAEVTVLLPRLFGDTLARQGLHPLYPAGAFDLVQERLAGDPDVLLQAAAIDGTTVAVQISLAGAATGLAWVVGRRQDQEGSDAYAAMMWRTLCWARDRGCREFDLVGAPTEGIANYKRGLGAEERRYTVYRYQARGYRLAHDLAARLHGARSRRADRHGTDRHGADRHGTDAPDGQRGAARGASVPFRESCR